MPGGQRIAFVSNRSLLGRFELYSIAIDGSGLQPMSGFPLDVADPDFSPDGKRIAIVLQDGIYVGSTTGAGLSRITDGRSGDRFPDWSPDGHRIAFVRGGGGIQIVSPDGSGLRALGLSGRSVVYDNYPTWSPDGMMIAFVGLEGLFVASADGGAVALVVPGQVYMPSWSR
jgi:Tol biopolymer transport system component